ncbi:hypothetical protein HUT19_16760 [Streptomyces sp. NA02950]|uniref:hypothetical protein n=1 Tax=Streptomyces sp. NA02950 TaxID=2742137 RepID=UPI0015911F0F|nr:hypothetical protein [Streptomyces sp. NA02950]QKV93204.1 hypothetical protein HUT19_16760 [Streptomyces sp. NA02950]
MSTIPPVPGPLPEEVAALLRAVVEALDIPAPATVGDAERFRAVLDERAMRVVVTLTTVLDGPTGIGAAKWAAAYLRKKLAEHPPTGYRAWDDQPRPDGEAAR